MEKDLSDKISITCSILISVNITSETEVKSVIHKGKNETMEKTRQWKKRDNGKKLRGAKLQ